MTTTNGDYQIIRIYHDGSGYEKVGPPIDRLLGDIWERFAGANDANQEGYLLVVALPPDGEFCDHNGYRFLAPSSPSEAVERG